MHYKRLGIISDCIHFYTNEGKVGTEIHIFLHQMEALSVYFSEVTIACPFSDFRAGSVYTTYSEKHIQFIPLPIVGGDSVKDKVKIISTFPKWYSIYKQLNRLSDIIYMRLPDNVSLPAFFYYYFKKKNAFITYTGTWDNFKGGAITWRFEKWLLRNVFKGPYWVYTNKIKESLYMQKGFSPSYTRSFWHAQTTLIENKKREFRKRKDILRFITVGSLVPYKNQLAIIEACRHLKEQQKAFSLTVVGDGNLRELYKQKIKEYGLEDEISLTGKKTRDELSILFTESDFVIQMPYQESYGKVPMEGLFFGLIPILSNVGLAAAFISEKQLGYICSPDDIDTLATILLSLYTNQNRFINMIDKGRAFIYYHTLENWAEEYYRVIQSEYA
jgi:glycosyltransferase involved in cell wall biosynthesis